MTHPGALLIKLPAFTTQDLSGLCLQVEEICRLRGLTFWRVTRIANTARAENDQPLVHIYLEGADAVAVTTAQRADLEKSLSQHLQAHVQASRLRSVMQRKGPAIASLACSHYVVETDIGIEWRQEVYRWYDMEHLPGLAQVPGCVRAQRWLNLDHGPASLACYDLTSPEVLGCEAWLKIRGTDWSSRCRPHFQNTLRTLFEQVQWPAMGE